MAASGAAVAADALAEAHTVLDRCDALARHSEEAGRLTRRFATPALAAARAEVAGWMEGAGLSAWRDNVGNLFGRYGATVDGARTLLLGSHLDTVRDAGRYDGVLGVLVGLAAVERLGRQGERLPFALEVAAFADEEGVRFGVPFLGSRALAGTLDPAAPTLTDADGITLAGAIRADGGDPGAVGHDRREPADLLGYAEVHIEQGPVLERAGLPVGVVTGIAGATRAEVRFAGEAGHAGTVPPALRRDALCAAAEFVLAAEGEARATAGLVATVGRVAVEPGVGNVIPGLAMLSLDVRHAVDAAREDAVRRLRARAEAIGAARGVGVGWREIGANPAVPCDGRLTDVLTRAVEGAGYPAIRLPSGAGHDAAVLAAVAPAAMLFVRCAGGVSHHPTEAVAVEDVAAAIEVTERFLGLVAREVEGAPSS